MHESGQMRCVCEGMHDEMMDGCTICGEQTCSAAVVCEMQRWRHCRARVERAPPFVIDVTLVMYVTLDDLASPALMTCHLV